MKHAFILLYIFLGTCAVHGQNQLDAQGRKTGPWRVEYPSGSTLYEGNFRVGLPIGLMTRYYETGAVRAEMTFDSHGGRSLAKLYYKGGKIAGEGIYLDTEKDSVWTYYSEFDGSVRIREGYLKGKIHGKSFRYYPSSEVSEELNWDMDSREGPWIQYFEGGALRLKGSYENNMLNGPYEVYFFNKALMMSGDYLNNQSEGTWSYYSDRGELLYTLEYNNGRPVDKEKYMELMQDTLLKYDSIQVHQPVQLF